jgi:hypothetical protein
MEEPQEGAKQAHQIKSLAKYKGRTKFQVT